MQMLLNGRSGLLNPGFQSSWNALTSWLTICGGDGIIEKYRSVDGGVCYLCGGKGYIEKADPSTSARLNQSNRRTPSPKPNVKTNVKRRSGKTGKIAQKDEKNKWRSGKTGKAIVKKRK